MKEQLLNLYKKSRDQYYYQKRKRYLSLLANYFDNETSIISSNCFAGRIYQDLKLPYITPTLGLYFFSSDYIKFTQNLEHNLRAPIEFIEHSQYDLGNERMQTWKHPYPVGLLDGHIEIHFLHYHSKEEALAKWRRRCDRVNLNKIVLIGSEQNLCDVNHIKDFSKSSYENKFFFTSQDYDICDTIFIKEFKNLGEVGDPYRKGDIYYKHMLKFLDRKNAEHDKDIFI